MKYYLREMHGSFVTARLIVLPDDKKPPEDIEDDNEESEILAHISQAPDTKFSRFMGITDFSQHFTLGPEQTSDGNLMGGHHLGRHFEITEKAALEILKKAEKIPKEDLRGRY